MTSEELRIHLMQYIGAKGVGEAVSAEDAELCDTVIENCHGELEQIGVALWVLDDIPSYAIEAFCIYAAPTLAGYHGKADEFPLGGKALGLRMLRELTADRRTATGTATYY